MQGLLVYGAQADHCASFNCMCDKLATLMWSKNAKLEDEVALLIRATQLESIKPRPIRLLYKGEKHAI